MLSSSSFLLAAVGLWSVLSPVAVASASQVWGEKRSLWNDGGQEGICEAFVACGADVCLRAPPVSPLYKTGTFPSSCYKTAPAGFHLGHWYRNYETFATWNLRRNNQLLATGSTNSSIYKIDQITYQVPGNCTHLDSIYGFETYTSISDVQTFHGTGLFAGISGPIETVAWGLDEKCEKYVVYYEWDGSATYGWTIITEAVDGPTPGTLASIEKQIKTVANGAWANITMYSSVHDGARNGQPYPVCDQACLTNNNSPNGTCPPS